MFRIMKMVFTMVFILALPLRALALTVEAEPNDSFLSASVLSPGDIVEGTLEGTDMDVFLLPVNVKVEILCRSDRGGVRFSVQDASGTVLTGSESSGY